MITKDGNACYFINKKHFQQYGNADIRIQGGEAIDGSYLNYLNMNDVYGITGDLRVYYCSNGIDSISRVSKDELDNEDLTRVIYSKDDKLSKLINKDLDGDKDITVSDAISLKTLTISDELENLNELFNFPNLKVLRLQRYKGSLAGIEYVSNLTDIYLYGCQIENYSNIKSLKERLNKLFFAYISDQEADKIFDNNVGIIGCDYSNLKYFGIFGDNYDENSLSYIISSEYSRFGLGKSGFTKIEYLSKLSSSTKNNITYLYLHNNSIDNILPLNDFNNLYYLRIEGNSITSLNGLQNKTNLTYLISDHNNIGYNIDNDTKNAESDSLSYLSNNKKMYYISLYDNDSIKWVSYLSNLTSLRFINMSNNTNIDATDLQNLKNIINICGSGAKFHSKYSLALLDDNTVKLDLKSQEIDKDVFMSLKTKTNITMLRIDDLKLLDGDEVITDDAIINTTINQTLSGLINLQYLSMNNIASLSSIDFADYTTKLIELDLFQTNVTNLSKLNSISTIRLLAIDNADIILSGENGIEVTLNRLGSTSSVWITGEFGLICNNADLTKKLENCTELTSLKMYQHNHPVYLSKLDLSQCTKLTYLWTCRVVATNWLMPASIIAVDSTYECGTYWDFSNCTSIERLGFNFYEYYGEQGIRNLLSTLGENTSIKELAFDITHSSITNLEFLSIFKDCPNVQKLTIGGAYTGNKYVKNVKGLEYLTNLKILNISGLNKLNSVSGIKNLTDLEYFNLNGSLVSDVSELAYLTKLKHLSMPNCCISNLYPISGLTHLGEVWIWNGKGTQGYVDFSGNAISDYSSYYINDKNEQILVNSINLLADLKNSNSFYYLYLRRNSGIIDWSPLINIGYDVSASHF